MIFDNYKTKIGKTYYYVMHNTIQSKIIGLEGYLLFVGKSATVDVIGLYFIGKTNQAVCDERSYNVMKMVGTER